MYAQLDHKNRKARKQKKCDYCGETIKVGKVYDWSKYVYDGNIYEWRCHLECAAIASEIWDYADPDEGMTEDLFQDTCREVCQTFVCPDCPKWDSEYQDCADDETYCISELFKFFQTHELYMAGREGYAHIWKAREKEK